MNFKEYITESKWKEVTLSKGLTKSAHTYAFGNERPDGAIGYMFSPENDEVDVGRFVFNDKDKNDKGWNLSYFLDFKDNKIYLR